MKYESCNSCKHYMLPHLETHCAKCCASGHGGSMYEEISELEYIPASHGVPDHLWGYVINSANAYSIAPQDSPPGHFMVNWLIAVADSYQMPLEQAGYMLYICEQVNAKHKKPRLEFYSGIQVFLMFAGIAGWTFEKTMYVIDDVITRNLNWVDALCRLKREILTDEQRKESDSAKGRTVWRRIVNKVKGIFA